jgi:hypothetical protein
MSSDLLYDNAISALRAGGGKGCTRPYPRAKLISFFEGGDFVEEPCSQRGSANAGSGPIAWVPASHRPVWAESLPMRGEHPNLLRIDGRNGANGGSS